MEPLIEYKIGWDVLFSVTSYLKLDEWLHFKWICFMCPQLYIIIIIPLLILYSYIQYCIVCARKNVHYLMRFLIYVIGFKHDKNNVMLRYIQFTIFKWQSFVIFLENIWHIFPSIFVFLYLWLVVNMPTISASVFQFRLI